MQTHENRIHFNFFFVNNLYVVRRTCFSILKCFFNFENMFIERLIFYEKNVNHLLSTCKAVS